MSEALDRQEAEVGALSAGTEGLTAEMRHVTLTTQDKFGVSAAASRDAMAAAAEAQAGLRERQETMGAVNARIKNAYGIMR